MQNNKSIMSNNNNTATFRTENHIREFEDQTVRFQILASAVMVSADDLIMSAKESAAYLNGELTIDVVDESLNLSMYARREVDIVEDENGDMDVWITSNCAIYFASKLSKELATWCRQICEELAQRRREISDSIEKRRPNWFFKDLLMPRPEDYTYCVGESMGDPVQTFYFNEHQISFRLMENANYDLQLMENANQIVDLEKQDCSEWFDLASTKQLFKSCHEKNHLPIIATNVSRDNSEVSPVWMDLTLAEDLATLVTKDYKLKLWLRNRAAEFRFFYDNASPKAQEKMHENDLYINSNCIISRT